MPSYLYLCKKKHGEFEEFHSITKKLEECPKCKSEDKVSEPVIRLISSGSTFILSSGGVGWYKQGYSK